MSEAYLSTGPEPMRRPVVRRRRRSRVVPGLVWNLLRACLVVGGPVALALWVLFSPYFLVREVEVGAGGRVSSAWVEESLAPFRGRHLLSISLPAVRTRLGAHPWVDVVEIRKELPHRLAVTVVERQPVALWRRGDELYYVDRTGRSIVPCPPGGGEGLPILVDRGTRFQDRIDVEPALALVADLTSLRPEWEGRVETVTLLGDDDYRVSLRDVELDLWVRSDALRGGLERLDRAGKILAAMDPPATGVDLRFHRRLVIRRAPGTDVSNEELQRSSTERTEG